MKKLHYLITAGATREFIDPVRFISNSSSGYMGKFLAESALKRNHKVSIISGFVSIQYPREAKKIFVVSAEEMLRAIERTLRREQVDVLIMCAAVSDYKPVKTYSKKIKRNKKYLHLTLIKNPDILGTIWQESLYPPVVVAFSVATNSIIKSAEKKLKEKKADLIVATSHKAFGNKRINACILMKDSKKHLEFLYKTKRLIAGKIIKLTEDIYTEKMAACRLV